MPASLQAIHTPAGRVLASHVQIPRTFVGRGLGLMFRSSLSEGSGVWLRPCNSIHMLFMNFPIDAVFLDAAQRIKKIYPNLRPWWGVVWVVWGAHSVLELPAGTAAGLQVGDMISIVKPTPDSISA